MSSIPNPLDRGRALAAAAALWLTPAYPHAVCGARIFPATLAIDDPGVLDELTLPTVSWVPNNSDGAQEWDASFSWTKTITPGLSVVIGAGPTWEHPGGYGWNGLDTELQWQALCIPDAEFMFKVGFDVGWAGTGTGMLRGLRPAKYLLSAGGRRSRLRSAAARLKYLRPFAITAEFSTTTPGQRLGQRHTLRHDVQLGVHPPIQPAVLQLAVGCDRQRLPQASGPSRRVRFSDADPQRRRRRDRRRPDISSPASSTIADKWQIALEAMIPMTGATGHGVGVIGSLDFYLDDIFPTRSTNRSSPMDLA